jgi:hypothetical protein
MMLAARSSRRRIPPRVGLDESAVRLCEAEGIEQFCGSPLRIAARVPEQPAQEDEVLESGELVVDGGELAGEAGLGAHEVCFAHEIVTEHPCRAGVGLKETPLSRLAH